MTAAQLLTAQKIISTKHFQSQFASVVREAEKKGNFYNVVRNSESIGVFLPKEIWESLLEDLEALSSPHYLARIAKSRKEVREGKVYSMDQVL